MLKLNGRVILAAGMRLGAVAAVFLAGSAVRVEAQTPSGVMSSVETAGYVVFPKILVSDPNAVPAVDTLIQLTNTANVPVSLQCYYVNANGHCGSENGPVCWTNEECTVQIPCIDNRCGGSSSGATCSSSGPNTCPTVPQECVPGWDPSPDFVITLTQEQPIGWSARTGLISGSDVLPCDGGGGSCKSSSQGDLKAVGEVPFRGELKCVQLDGSDNPAVANNLKGEATIIRSTLNEALAVSAYNAVGFQAISAGEAGDRATGILCLGEGPGDAGANCSVTYAPCPNVLIAEHFFDGAGLPQGKAQVKTNLTLVPCSEDLRGLTEDAEPPTVRAQMLVYNEFEQRFSTDTKVQCYRDTLLSDIDTTVGDPSDDRYSVFSYAVQGTLTGQTRIRGVEGPPAANGYGLIGLVEEEYMIEGTGPLVATAAYDLQADSFGNKNDGVFLRPRQ